MLLCSSSTKNERKEPSFSWAAALLLQQLFLVLAASKPASPGEELFISRFFECALTHTTHVVVPLLGVAVVVGDVDCVDAACFCPPPPPWPTTTTTRRIPAAAECERKSSVEPHCSPPHGLYSSSSSSRPRISSICTSVLSEVECRVQEHRQQAVVQETKETVMKMIGLHSNSFGCSTLEPPKKVQQKQ